MTAIDMEILAIIPAGRVEKHSAKGHKAARMRTRPSNFAASIFLRAMRRGIANVLRDAGLRESKGGINTLLTWLQDDALTYPWSAKHTGATALYHIKKN